MDIGKRIKARREQLGLRVDDVATMLGKNRATIYRYENGDIENLPIEILKPLAKVLQTTPAELMGWSTDATRFAETAEVVNRNLLEQKHLAVFRKLNDENREKIIMLTQKLLEAQSAEENILIAAHRREGDEE